MRIPEISSRKLKCNGAVESQIFCQPRKDGHDRGKKNIHKLIYYLPPSECTGNTIIYSIISRYLGCPEAQQ